MANSLISGMSGGYGALRGLRNGVVAMFLASAAVAEPVTVLALGDSLTQGYGLPPEEGFVPTLEEWLENQGLEVDVINAGVSGDTTQGGLSRVAWSITPEVDAIIVALGGNDLLRGIAPELARANLDGILFEATRAGLEIMLVGMTAPGNYGPDYKAAFDGMYPELAETYGALYYPSFFAAFDGEADVPADLGAFVQPDGLHPSAAGVDRIVAHMGPSVAELVATVSP